MKSKKFPAIRVLCLFSVLLLMVFPLVSIAGEPPTLDKQLEEAILYGNIALAKDLIEKGADVNANARPIFLAISSGKVEMVTLLLDAGADVNSVAGPGLRNLTPLMAANRAGRAAEPLVRLLLERGADVNAYTTWGNTALMSAPNLNLARLYLDKGANVNAKDKDGVTALMEAARHGRADVVAVLIEKGSDITAKDKRGMTALREAEIRNDRATIALLKAAGAAACSKGDGESAALKQLIRCYKEDPLTDYPDTPEGVVKAFITEALGEAPINLEEMRSCTDVVLQQHKYFPDTRDHANLGGDFGMNETGFYLIFTGF